MKNRITTSLLYLLITATFLSLSGCGYNGIQNLDEQTKSAWSQVVNQYQRRSDLIPNLVNTVKGYASHEKEVLTSVVEARAKATSVNITAEQALSPEQITQFQSAQNQLSSSLGKLLAVSRKLSGFKS